MTVTGNSCKRGKVFLYMSLQAHWPRPLLWILPIHFDLARGGCFTICGYGGSFPWLRAPMGTDIILRRHRYYKSFLRDPLPWWGPGHMALGRVRGR